LKLPAKSDCCSNRCGLNDAKLVVEIELNASVVAFVRLLIEEDKKSSLAQKLKQAGDENIPNP
jgi:hypothetical protein